MMLSCQIIRLAMLTSNELLKTMEALYIGFIQVVRNHPKCMSTEREMGCKSGTTILSTAIYTYQVTKLCLSGPQPSTSEKSSIGRDRLLHTSGSSSCKSVTDKSNTVETLLGNVMASDLYSHSFVAVWRPSSGAANIDGS